MINDNNEIDTLEECILEGKKKIIQFKQMFVQLVSPLFYMLPDAINQIMPYSGDIKEHSGIGYAVLIGLHISITVYLGYKQMKLNKEIKNVSHNS